MSKVDGGLYHSVIRKNTQGSSIFFLGIILVGLFNRKSEVQMFSFPCSFSWNRRLIVLSESFIESSFYEMPNYIGAFSRVIYLTFTLKGPFGLFKLLRLFYLRVRVLPLWLGGVGFLNPPARDFQLVSVNLGWLHVCTATKYEC